MAKLDKGFLAKLKSMLLHLRDIRTEDGKNLMVDDELEVGKDILIDVNGEWQPAPDGDYDTGEVIIRVEAGKVAEIRAKNVEQPVTEDEAPVAEPMADEVAEGETADEDIDSLRAERDRLKAERDRLEAENNDLRQRIAELEQRIEMTAAVPPIGEDGKSADEEKNLTHDIVARARRRQ